MQDMNKANRNVERGMRLLGAYFGAYIAVGFIYPIAVGESVLETASQRLGWKEKGQPKMDCASYHDQGKQ
jgi:hypothetical protein